MKDEYPSKAHPSAKKSALCKPSVNQVLPCHHCVPKGKQTAYRIIRSHKGDRLGIFPTGKPQLAPWTAPKYCGVCHLPTPALTRVRNKERGLMVLYCLKSTFNAKVFMVNK